jgi:fructose-1,6-bisphosphatase/sedoheptulose 1,7-bisphosphatase-like protein
MKAFADLADLPEDKRIRAIAEIAEHGHSVAFVVEDDAKADRYIEKLTKFNVHVTARGDGPVAGTVFVKVERRSDS